jgi:hypothetical protein
VENVPRWKGRYFPWIGDAFRTQAGARLLVLGESHHFRQPKHDRREATRELIYDAITPGTSPYLYFKVLPEILAGDRSLDVVGRAKIWNAIAFENIVQEAADPKTRRPRAGAIERGKPALYQLINYLQPTHVLFVSRRAWDGVPYDKEFRGRSQETLRVDGRHEAYELHLGCVGGVTFWMTYILHPTNGHPPPPVSQSSQVVTWLLAQRSAPSTVS